MPGKYYNLDTDNTLGGENSADIYIASQRAVRTFVDGEVNTLNEKIDAIEIVDELAELQDTKLSQLSDGQALVYDATSGKWINHAISTDGAAWGNITGSLSQQTDLNTALNNKANKSHSHTMSQITDLTIPTKVSDLQNDSGFITNSALTGYVQDTRKVNNKALSSDITLTYSDVGALSASTSIPTVTDTYNASSSNAMSGKAVASAISGKQNTISDLATIRAGASAGATAIQPGANVSSLTNDAGYLTSADISAALIYKGTKATVDELPTTGNKKGDVWTVIDNGAEYVWDGSNWQYLGQALDLSGYATKTDLNSYVPTSRKINNKTLTSNITLTYSDVTAASASHTHTYSDVGAASASHTHNYVPTSRTVNSKALTSNITLSASDVGALPSDTFIPTITDTFDASSVDGMSGKAVASAIAGKTDDSTLAAVAKSGSYADLSNKPTIGNAEIEIQKNGTKVQSFTTNQTGDKKVINITVPTTYSDVSAASASHTHTYSDVGAASSAHTHTYSDVGAASSSHTHGTDKITALTSYTIATQAAAISATDSLNTALGKLQKSIDGKQASGSYVPTTRKVNNKALSADISLTYTDVNAASASHNHDSAYAAKDTAVTHTASTSVGDTITPVYIASDGKATALGYTISKSVPSDAKFTDTVYTHPTTSGNKHIPSGGTTGKILKWSADGTATWETEYSYTHPTTAGNKHIPSGGTTNQILKWSSDGTATWANEYSYTHPTNSGNKHIPSGGTTNQILRWSADGTAVWGNDNNTTYSAGSGLSLSGTTFKHTNAVTSGTVGTNAGTSGSTLAVPYVTYDTEGHITATGTHTHTITGFAPSNTAVTHTASTAVGGTTTPIYIASDGKATALSYTIAKSVPSDAKFTDTTYTAGTGLSLSGTQFKHSNSITAGTAGTNAATSGSTLAVPYVTYDSEGHITGKGTHTHTVTGFLTQHQDISGKANASEVYTKTEIDGKLASGMHFKGTVASASALPTQSNQTGDMYNVTDTGANYAWDGTAWDKLSENVDLSGLVPNTRKVNSKALNADITLTYSDVNAASATHTHTYSDVGAASSAHTHSTYVPTSRKVNNKALTADITLTYSDVNALSSSTFIPTITDTYNSSSTNGMSGKAVASAISTKQNSNTAVTHTASTAVGNTITPVYVASNGTATALSYTIAKSVPSNAVFTDTNNAVTNTLNTTTKAYITGTTNAATNTGGQIFDTGVYLDTTAGRLNATTMSLGTANAIMSYNSTTKSIDFTFA